MNEKKQDAVVSRREPTGKGKRVKRRWLRRLIVAGGLLLIVLVVLVLLAPTFVSTGAGKGFVLGKVNDSIVGEIEMDGLSVGWRSGQSLTGVVVRGADGVEVARVGKIDLPGASLWSLVRGGLTLGEVRIERVTSDIIGYEDGTTNLQRALAASGGASGSAGKTGGPTGGKSGGKTGSGGGGSAAAWPEGLSFDLVLRDIDISYRAAGVDEPVRLSVSEADVLAGDPEHLVMKLSAELSRADRKGTVTADAQVDGLFDASGVYQPDAATARGNVAVADLPTGLLDELMDQGGKLTALLGPMINGRVQGEVTAGGGSATVEVVSEHMDIGGELAFDDAGLAGVGASHVRLTVTPQAWAVLSAEGDKPASTLGEPVDVAIELVGFGLPISDDGLALADARVDLKMTIGDVSLRIDEVGVVSLKGTSGGIQTARLGSLMTGQFKTTSSINGKPGGVSLDIELADLIDGEQQLNTSGLTAKINGALTNAPIAAVLDELMPGVTHGLATRAFGPTLDAQVNVHAGPRAEGAGVGGKFDVDLLTEGGETGLTSTLIGRFDFDEQELTADLADGSYAKFTLTPGLMEAYREAFGGADEAEEETGRGQVSLAGATTWRMDVSEAFARLTSAGGEDDSQGYTLDPASVRLTGRLKSTELMLDQDGRLAATLTNLLVDINSGGLAGDTRVVLHAKVEYPNTSGGTSDPPRPGAIESATNISGLIGGNGEMDLSAASYQTVTHIRQAPIDLIDAIFDMEGELVAAVGPRARIDVVGSYTPPGISSSGTSDEEQDHGTGGFDLTLKSRTASADMKLLVEDGKWTLKADAPLSFQVTPRLSQTMLKKVNPFLGGAISGRLPIGVTVKQEGFSVPWRDAAISDVNAAITLELGELDLRGEGLLKDVLEALGVGGRSLLNVRFSPVAINLDGGKLSYKDLTMSMGDVVLGFSGEVDLNTEHLDLTMTIPGSSLSNIKWLQGAISPDQVIVVPLGGTFDRPTLDIKLLTGEIAKAALQGQLKGVVGDAIGDKIGGEAGVLLGGLLDELLAGKKPAEQAQGTTDDSTDVAVEETSEQPVPSDAKQTSKEPGEPVKPAVVKPLTDEERAARRERRQKRRKRLERLEREQAERDAQSQ